MEVCKECQSSEQVVYEKRTLCKRCYARKFGKTPAQQIKKHQRYLKDKEKYKERYLANKDNVLAYEHEWYLKNRERCIEKNHRWYQENKEYEKRRTQKWVADNKDYVYKRHREYCAKREAEDLNFKLSMRLRTRLSCAVKRGQKAGKTLEMLGCSIDELKKFLEEKFYPHPETGVIMSWDNYGHKTWHIDHIIPLCSFDLMNAEQANIACHYTNLQPLWKCDHDKKTPGDIKKSIKQES